MLILSVYQVSSKELRRQPDALAGSRPAWRWRGEHRDRIGKPGMSSNFCQRPDTELGVRRFAIALLKLGQEKWALLLRSCFPHDLAAVQLLTLAGWFSGRAVR